MTQFQKKLKSYVWGFKAIERHWFLKESAPRLLRPPSSGEQITIKRAIYAAFSGDIPEGMDLRPDCGAVRCVAPHHQKFEASRSGNARSLHLPDLDGIGLDERPNRLPKGLTLSAIAKVKDLSTRENSLQSICASTQLDRQTVMKIRGGVFDRAVNSLRRSVAIRRKNLAEAGEQAKALIEDEPLQGEEYDSAGVPPEAIDDEDSEAVAWLRTVQ